MKLLVVLSRFPYPLEKGDKLRAYYQIKELSRNNEVLLCCFTHSWVNKKYLKELRSYCADIKVIKLSWWMTVVNLFKSFASEDPFQVAYFHQEKAQKEFDDYVIQHLPKHIYCQLLRVVKYVEKYTPYPKTLDYMDVFSVGAKRRVNKAPFYLKRLLRQEAERLKKYESKIFEFFELKTIISEQDRDFIEHPKRDEIMIVRNGVNTDYFKPQLEVDKSYDLVFTGNMAYPPNVDGAIYLVSEILPLVRLKIPDVRLVIAGATPTKKVQDLKSEFVTVTGWVDDIRVCYAQSKLFIAPMRIGTGLQNKLLEAMAMELACITTPLANNALGAEPGINILTGNTTDELAQHIITLLKNDNLRAEIANSGHQFVHQSYNWATFCNELDTAIKSCDNG